MNPDDAVRVGLDEGGRARVVTKRGSAVVDVELTDSMLPGHVSLPNGFGLDHPDTGGERVVTGVAPNELTDNRDRDPFAGTPWHKSVPARIEAV